MKKNAKRFLTLLCLAAMILSLAACGSAQKPQEEEKKEPIHAQQSGDQKQDQKPEKDQKPVEELKEENKEPEELPAPVPLDDALFIGDSRTVGLMEYTNVGADFFATVGMSVYNIHDDAVAVPNVGRVTLEELLANKSYGKIYIMLGINEVGYNQERTIGEYADLVHQVRAAQPDAKIYLQANLHVSQESSDASEYVTNERLDSLNHKIEKLAAQEGAGYLDVNSVFDDESGALDVEATSDGIHPYAKYYVQWCEWIARQSAVK